MSARPAASHTFLTVEWPCTNCRVENGKGGVLKSGSAATATQAGRKDKLEGWPLTCAIGKQ
eukprot:2556530-Amphidinium_carterae.1